MKKYILTAVKAFSTIWGLLYLTIILGFAGFLFFPCKSTLAALGGIVLFYCVVGYIAEVRRENKEDKELFCEWFKIYDDFYKSIQNKPSYDKVVIRSFINKLEKQEGIKSFNSFESDDPYFDFYFQVTGQYNGGYFKLYMHKSGNITNYDISDNITDNPNQIKRLLDTLINIQFEIK